MDSFDFYRTVVAPAPDRTKTDDTLTCALRWIGRNAPPDYVFAAAQLHAWALANGYSKQADLTQIANLLRRVLPLIPVGPATPAGEINDTLIALTRYVDPTKDA